MNIIPDSPSPSKGCSELLYLPAGCLLRASPFLLLGLMIALILGFLYSYYNLNVEILGIGRPAFSSWIIGTDFSTIQIPGKGEWKITFETQKSITFSGRVRHVNPIRESAFPILTHDILVTSGDFADPALVDTRVTNHHFTWRSASYTQPQGTINLLHIVPAEQQIYDLLLAIQNGNRVSITGREILRIDGYDQEAQLISWWQDTGCNTILVTAVEIQESP